MGVGGVEQGGHLRGIEGALRFIYTVWKKQEENILKNFNLKLKIYRLCWQGGGEMHGLEWRGMKKEERREYTQFLRGTKLEWVVHVVDEKSILTFKINILRAMGHSISDLIAGASFKLAYPYDWRGFVGTKKKTSVGLLVYIQSSLVGIIT